MHIFIHGFFVALDVMPRQRINVYDYCHTLFLQWELCAEVACSSRVLGLYQVFLFTIKYVGQGKQDQRHVLYLQSKMWFGVVLCSLESMFHSHGLDLRQILVLWCRSFSVLLKSASQTSWARKLLSLTCISCRMLSLIVWHVRAGFNKFPCNSYEPFDLALVRTTCKSCL